MVAPGIHSYARQTASRTTFVILALVLIWFLVLLGLAVAVKLAVAMFLTAQTGGIWALSRSSLPPASQFVPWILLAAAAFVLIQLIIFRLRGPEPMLRRLGAEPPSKDDFYHKRFLNIVDELAVSAGTARPTAWVIPALYKNAFSLEGHICVTEGLLSALSREELTAVAAHEFGHILIGDIQMRTLISGMISFLGLPMKIGRLAETRIMAKLQTRRSTFNYADSDHPDPEGAGLLAFPALLFAWIVVTVYTSIASVFVRLMSGFVNRNYEFQADATAVKLTRDPVSLARALHKIGSRRSDRNRGVIDPALEMCFIVNQVVNRIDEQKSQVADLFSTHPPLADRIEVLLGMGHAGIRDLEDRPEEAQGRTSPVTFEALVDGAWLGPMALADLFTKTSIGPETLIRTSNGHQGNARMLMARHFAASTKTFKKCPRCESDLVMVDYESAHILRCARCSGVLVKNPELAKIIARRMTTFSEAELALGDQVLDPRSDSGRAPTINEADPSHRLNCPVCSKAMDREFYNIAYKVPVDRCKPCRVIWLDSGELEKIQIVFERLN